MAESRLGKTTTQRMRAVKDDATFTRNLRYEIADIEGRAILGSSGISLGLGLVWILLVIFGPATDLSHLLPAAERPIEVQFEAPPPPEDIKTVTPPTPAEPVAAPAAAAAPKAAAPKAPPKAATKPAGARPEKSAAAISSAFGAAAPGPTNGPVGDVSNVLRGVAVASNSTPAGAATAGKQVLAYGQGGAGSRTPGLANIGGGGTGAAGIGGVTGGGGFGAQAVRISAPRVIDAPSVGGVGRDVGQLGTAVRDHQSQLQFCYQEYGLKVNPSLAGSVTLSLTLTGGGSVSDATVTGRTWSGPGADASESCIVQRARAWHFPSSPAGGGTYEFTFNFNK